MAVYTNPIIDQEYENPKVVYYLDSRCAVFTCNGNPEGIIQANTGSLALSDNGLVYKKTTDFLTTGWVEIGAGSVPTGISEVIFRNSTNQPNNPGGVDVTIFTIPILAGSLANLDSFLEYIAEFSLAGNANTKAIAALFGGQNIATASWNNNSNSLQLQYTARVYRTSATTFRGYVQCTLPIAGQTTPYTNFADRAVVDMDVNDLNLEIIVFGDAANDIIHRVSHLSLNV